jgi:3-oxoacyl-[acyl-carrier protein] reductase
MNLSDKWIAVTGSGQGLGRAMALELCEHGANLIIIDINADKINETVGLCEKSGQQARGYRCNISDETEVIQLFKNIHSDIGNLYGLVNNAGILRDGLLIKAKDGAIQKKMSLSDWQSVIDVNLTGVFLCAREAAEIMILGGEPGVIVNISSISRAGNLGQTNYTAAKAGVAAMTVTWAKELSRYQIRVGAVAPGFIETEMTGSMKPEVLEAVKQTVPLKRLGLPKEIAHSVRYIMENEYFSGRIIECDGALRI